ncbi:hypothetical protein QPM17_23325, partial [Marinobacter sp. TBZ242]
RQGARMAWAAPRAGSVVMAQLERSSRRMEALLAALLRAWNFSGVFRAHEKAAWRDAPSG